MSDAPSNTEDVLATAAGWRDAGEEVALATVTRVSSAVAKPSTRCVSARHSSSLSTRGGPPGARPTGAPPGASNSERTVMPCAPC